jgi:hypothetical protein
MFFAMDVKSEDKIVPFDGLLVQKDRIQLIR